MTRSFVLAALLALPATALADDAKAEAKAHVARATALHKEGKHADALVELREAYELDPQPQLLFAIGQVHVQLGLCSDAIRYYEQFLATKPAPALATVTREAIEACKTNPPPPVATPAAPVAVIEAPPPPPAPPPAPPPPPRAEPRPWYADKLGVALIGGGLVTGVVGIVLWTGARSDRDDADGAATYDEFESLVDRAHTKQTAALVLGVAGAALVGAGGVHLWLHRRDEAVIVAPTAGGAAVSWSGRW